MTHSPKPVRVALIGAGLIGQTHSMVLKQVAKAFEGSVEVLSVFDSVRAQAERVASYWPRACIAESLASIVQDSAIDAVWICTPTASHLESCLAAARAGKHIFCEKPIAMNAAEAAEMAAAIARSGVMSQVGLVLRFSPIYTVVRSMIAEPGAGRLLSIAMRDDQDFPIRGVHNSAWRNDPSLTAGGTLIEHSVHDFDLLTWIGGAVRSIYSRTRCVNGAPGIEDFAATEIEFAGGWHGQMTSIWHRMIKRPSNRRLEVFAENLFVACDHDTVGPIIAQRGEGDEEQISEGKMMSRFTDIILAERPYLGPIKDWLAVPYAAEDATFVAAMRGECEPYPAFIDGIAAQRLVEAAYSSARGGRKIEIKVID